MCHHYLKTVAPLSANMTSFHFMTLIMPFLTSMLSQIFFPIIIGTKMLTGWLGYKDKIVKVV